MHDLPVFRSRWRDHGFSTLEIIVAITLLGFLLTAVGPQFLSSNRATNRAKLLSQAKGVVQGQLDTMRALPFRVAPAAGDYLDVLDTYYRNLTAPVTAPVCGSSVAPKQPLASWTGYVPAASSARCAYEPAGAFSRYVLAAGTQGLPANMAVVVDTQFVSATTPSTVIAPASTYNSQTPGRDRAPVQQVGVTATALFSDHGVWKPLTVYSQIASDTPATPQIKLAAGATALEIGSTAADGLETLSLTGGQMQLTGSLFNTSEAKASLMAMGAASSTSGRQSGAALAVSAPHTNAGDLDAGQGGLKSECSGICWGANAVTPFVLAADDALPRAGVQVSPGVIRPVHTLLRDNGPRDGFQFRTGLVTLPGLNEKLVSLDAAPGIGTLTPLGPPAGQARYQCAPTGTARPTSHVTTSGYLNSTDATAATDPMSVDACGATDTNVIRILPTALAPHGLVRITARSSARCSVTGEAHTASATADYRAEVEYWKWTPGFPGSGAYFPLPALAITPGTTTDPLADPALLATKVSEFETLGDYIESWAGLTSGGVQKSVSGRVASLTIPALVTIQTKPLRGVAEPASAVSLAVGASSCHAEDNR